MRGDRSFEIFFHRKFTMGKEILVLLCLLLLQCFFVLSVEAKIQEKAEATVPITTLSPPEGNTTFLGGTTWCVALAGVTQIDLQNALDWACGLGMTDCKPIQEGEACFEPDTLVSHASYAFNNYYQQNGNSDIACNFGGTATLTKNDPSYAKCAYNAAGPIRSSAPPMSKFRPNLKWWKVAAVLLGKMLLLVF